MKEEKHATNFKDTNMQQLEDEKSRVEMDLGRKTENVLLILASHAKEIELYILQMKGSKPY